MEEVLELYQQPYDPQFPQICLDEKSVQLLENVRDELPVRPGDVAKQDHEYQRNGTANIFCVFEPLTNWRQLRVTEHRKRQDFARLIRNLLEGRYQQARKLIIVADHLHTHSPASFYETFPPEQARALSQRVEFHYTPKHGSWLNVADQPERDRPHSRHKTQSAGQPGNPARADGGGGPGIMIGFILIGICVAIETVEQMLYRIAGRNARRYLPVVALAIALHLSGLVFWYLLLRLMPMRIALPLSGLSYATIAVACACFFRERITPRRWLGIACIMAGFAMISLYGGQS